jgi:hypothetical protein
MQVVHNAQDLGFRVTGSVDRTLIPPVAVLGTWILSTKQASPLIYGVTRDFKVIEFSMQDPAQSNIIPCSPAGVAVGSPVSVSCTYRDWGTVTISGTVN